MNAIKTRRLELRITQEELAQKIGVHSSYISYLESGARKLRTDYARKIAKVLKCRMCDLPVDDSRVRYNIVKLTKEERQARAI